MEEIIINDKFPFPEDWDINNERTVAYFNKCSQYVETQQELISLFHIKPFYYIYSYVMIICISISTIFIIICRDNYIIKRTSPMLLIIFCIGCIICITNSYGIQVHYTTYPCFLVFYLTGISYPMVFISCIACFSKYIKQYYTSANAYLVAVESNNNMQEKKIKKKSLNSIREYLIEKHPVRFIILYIIIITIYSFTVSPFGKNYRIIGDVDLGFCTLSVEYAPQLLIILTFIFLYVPYILNELRKIEDTFKIKNLIYISVIIMSFSVIGYLITSLIPVYNCTPEFIRFWPTDCFVILCCTVFHILHVVKPLLEILYVKFSIKKIDKSMNGLKKLLKDKTLFREYAEFCKSECCVENTLFYKEYHIFKDTVYRISNKKNPENSISMNTLVMDENDITTYVDQTESFSSSTKCPSAVNSNNINSINSDSYLSNKNSSYRSDAKYNNDYLILLKMAQDIIEKFILPNSEYEISIDNKIAKRILNTFHVYERMKSENNVSIEDLKNSDFVNIFDDAYEEVLTNLYLNTYLKYIKRNSKN